MDKHNIIYSQMYEFYSCRSVCMQFFYETLEFSFLFVDFHTKISFNFYHFWRDIFLIKLNKKTYCCKLERYPIMAIVRSLSLRQVPKFNEDNLFFNQLMFESPILIGFLF